MTESEAALRRALELSPHKAGVAASLSLTLLDQGRGEEALSDAMRESDEIERLGVLAIVHHALGHGPESDAALKEMTENHAETFAYSIAEVYSRRGQMDAAFQWLERAYARRDGGLTDVKKDRGLRLLHTDSRWGVFLKKMGEQFQRTGRDLPRLRPLPTAPYSSTCGGGIAKRLRRR